MKTIIAYISIITFLTAFVQQASGQNYRRIYSDFQKLERYIQRIEQIVTKVNDERAWNNIISAKTELEKARALLFTKSTPRPQQARLHMARAKKYADIAANIVLSRPFKSLKAQLDDLINDAERIVAVSRSEEAHYLVNQAKKFRRLAYNAFAAERMIRAREYYRISYFFAQKCIDFAGQKRESISEQIIELELSVQQLLNQARDFAQKEPNIVNLVDEAEEHYQEALRLADEGKARMAVNRLQLIRRFLYRIFEQADRSSRTPEERLSTSLYSLRAYLQSLERDLEANGDTKLKKLYQKAWQLYEEAESAYQNRKYRQAEKKISLSQRFANTILKQHRDERIFTSENLTARIEDTRSILQMQQNEVSSVQNISIRSIHVEALGLLEDAERKLDAGNKVQASQLIQAATRMSARIQRLLGRSPRSLDAVKIKKNYNRLIDYLNRLEQNETLNSKYRNIMDQLNQFAQSGHDNLEQGNLELANEYIETALQQIKQFTDKWRKKS